MFEKWQFTSYITPQSVVLAFAGGVGLFVLERVLRWQEVITTKLGAWGLLIDFTAILSLLITLAILSDVEEIEEKVGRIEDKYLFRATAPDLQDRLETIAQSLADLLRKKPDKSKQKLQAVASRADANLKQIEELVLDEEVESDAQELRELIDEYQEDPDTEPDDYYDILSEIRRIEEHLEGLINRSQKRVVR